MFKHLFFFVFLILLEIPAIRIINTSKNTFGTYSYIMILRFIILIMSTNCITEYLTVRSNNSQEEKYYFLFVQVLNK